MNYLENSTKKEKDSIKAIIDETFAIVSSYEKTNDWQYPHHTLKDNELTLNVNGLKAAALFLLKPTTSKNLSSEDRIKIANHLCKHYDELDIETPDKLTNISENSESIVVVNVNDDELKEYAESFDIGVENVSIYIGLFESLVTDLVNSGVIDIKDKSKDADDSIIPVQLSKDQVEEFLKYFDIMSDDILNILSNKLTSMSYKKTDADLENKLSASESIISDLKEKIDGLDDTIKTQASELKKSTSVKYDKSLVDNKFAVIINFVKSADNQNDTLIQFINNVIEAESERDIGYLTKLGKSFMKSKGTDSTQFIKKSKVVNRFNDDDYDKLLGYVGKDKGEDVKESVESSRIERLMDYL